MRGDVLWETILGPLVLHLLDTLFPSYGFLDTFSRSSIRASSLTTDWQAATMPKATITLDVAQSSNVLLNHATQLAFQVQLVIHMIIDPSDFVVR